MRVRFSGSMRSKAGSLTVSVPATTPPVIVPWPVSATAPSIREVV